MSKTTKLLLLLFTIFWFVPFSLIISENYGGGITVSLTGFTKSPFNIYSYYYFSYSSSKSNRWREVSVRATRSRYVIAAFHSPGWYLSKKISPKYAGSTTMMKGEASKAVALLEKIDSAEEKELARKYEIQRYPKKKRYPSFVAGVHSDIYHYDSTRDAAATWVNGKMIPVVYNVRTTEEAEHILAAGSTIVLGFFDTLKGPDNAELAAASILQTDVKFYQTDSARVAKIFQIDPKIKRPALVILKNGTEVYSQFDGQFTRLAITDFVSMNKLPLVITFNSENSLLIISNHLKQLWLLASANDSDIMSTFQDAAKVFKGKLLFVYAEIVYDVTQIYLHFGANGGTQMTISHPQIVAYTYDLQAKNVLYGELTMSKIKLFGENFLEDKFPSYPIARKVLKFRNCDRYAF